MNSCKIIANTIRGLSVDGVAAANSGHPGMPLGMADVCAVLWSEHMNFNPKNPKWLNRDRFILSAGHGSMLIYSLLHLYGYDLSMDDLKAFRQWGSKTPGHPENFVTDGVETTTGPLGQGVANAVGFALAEASLAARYNREGSEIIDHYTYVVAGDGCLQEGISHEACSFAGHNKLGKLIMLYDSNNITIDGPTHISFTEDTRKRFEAYGWQVLEIDGHDYDQINAAIAEAKKEKSKPSIIICKTIIGFGSPNRAGTSKAHGEPFPAEEIELMKEKLGLPKDKSFFVPDEISDLRAKTQEKGESLENKWNELWENYKNKNQEAAKELENSIKGEISKEALDIPQFGSEKAIATRSASGTVLNHIAKYIPQLMGGSADLTPSNNTLPAGEESFSPENPKGRYIRYGVREHGMAAIMNGMALHGGVLPYSGTFFVFSDYMRPAMRMSALMEQQVVYVLTHDSIGLGEDGPTHQPEAHLWAYRMIPNMTVIRPMDANETAEAWKSALKNKKVRQLSEFPIDFTPEKELLQQQFTHLYQLAERTDITFKNAVKAQEVRQLKGLEKLEKRLLKAQKRKFSEELERTTILQSELFPNNILQERFANFTDFYLLKGKEFIPELVKDFNPFDFRFVVIHLPPISKI